MIGGEIGRPGLELDRPRARRCRSPTAVRAGPGVVRSSGSNRASTRSRQRSGPASIRAGSSWWPRIRPSRRGDRDVDAGRAEVGDEDVPGVGAEGQLAWRPPPVLGPTSPSLTSPRSISSPTRWATIARPRPVRATSSERDRERPRRISSRTVTSASSASSGSGPRDAPRRAPSGDRPCWPADHRPMIRRWPLPWPTFALDMTK